MGDIKFNLVSWHLNDRDINTHRKLDPPTIDALFTVNVGHACGPISFNDIMDKFKHFATGNCHIKKVIFNDPATIILWEDGTKTVVKYNPDDDFYDPEKGMAIAICKKVLGDDYKKTFKKWLPKEEPMEEDVKNEFLRLLAAQFATGSYIHSKREKTEEEKSDDM